MKKPFLKLLIAALALLAAGSCTADQIMLQEQSSPAGTRAIPTLWFDWETVDWMPTPPGQTLIPPPWTGPGALTWAYDLDVINDRKASDGWELLYTNFDANAAAPINNPYFILYNKYRGIMRVFYYLTTQNILSSSYLMDGGYIFRLLRAKLLPF